LKFGFQDFVQTFIPNIAGIIVMALK